MNAGELLTRGTIWIALLMYVIGAMLLSAQSGALRISRLARAAWTIGIAFFIAHVICAFGYYHSWSHAAAYSETARQTEQMTGVRSGSGLYLNYAFGVGWLAMVLWWWVQPRKFFHQARFIAAAWNGFAVFMIFNGTVVFGRGLVRWFGGALCAALAVTWWITGRKRARGNREC